jgi:hypothetical protein
VHAHILDDVPQSHIIGHIEETLEHLYSVNAGSLSGIRAVERRESESGVTYGITQLGLALLESGGTLEDTIALANWQDSVRSTFSEHEKQCLGILYLAGIVFTPSLQKMIPQAYSRPNRDAFTKVCTGAIRTCGFSELEASKLLEKLCNILDNQSKRMGQRLKEQNKLSTKQNESPDAAYRRTIREIKNKSYNALMGLVLWTQGVSLNEIEEKLSLSSNSNAFFPPKIVERAAWMAKLLVQSFGYNDLFMDPASSSLAANLESRLRYGVPEAVVPFLAGGSLLSRLEATDLFERHPPEIFLPALLGSPKIQNGIYDGVSQIVTNYYMGQCEQLSAWVRHAIADDDAAEIVWQSLSDMMLTSMAREKRQKYLLSTLYSVYSDLDWGSLERRNEMSSWALIVLAVLLKHEMISWDDITDSRLNALTDVHLLLSEKGFSSTVIAGLATIFPPASF